MQCVLVEGRSKRSEARLAGCSDGGRRVVIDDLTVPAGWAVGVGSGPMVRLQPGEYAAVLAVLATSATAASLSGTVLGRTTLRTFY